MSSDAAAIVPRSRISLGVEPTLRRSIAQLAKGRVLVIDYFASRRCSVVIGDLTGDFRDAPPGRGYIELATLEGVRVFAAPRLLGVLGDARPSLRLGGPPFARHLAVDLDPPERWIDFLEGPGVLAGQRRFAWRQR
jgi:hypothetical protein